MDVLIGDFVQTLRRHGLRVSTAEALDALAAVRTTGVGDRAVVHDVLRSALVKDSRDIEAFDALFARYFTLFPPPELAADEHGHGHGHGHPPSRLSMEQETVEPSETGHGHSHGHDDEPDARMPITGQRQGASQDHHGDSDHLKLSLFAQELLLTHRQDALQHALRNLTHQLRIRRARGVLNPGALTPVSAGAELPVDISAGELADLLNHLEELDVDPALLDVLEAQADRLSEGLPELVRALLERRRKLDEPDDPDAHAGTIGARDLMRVSPGEQAGIEAAIRRLARSIHGAPARRQRRRRTGRVDVPQTLRRNLRYEGIPFEPVLRDKPQQRPRLVVLCDVSLSTRNLARFWLQLVHGTQRLFSRVRTFAFVADIVEVTDVFETRTLEDAVATLLSGDLLDVDVNSDFGQVIDTFCTHHLDAVNRRTTVVILGDGRNNGRPANEQALGELASRSRQLIWMTPEPRWGWSLGDCAMPRYETYCDRVEVVRTVDQLGAVAEALVG